MFNLRSSLFQVEQDIDVCIAEVNRLLADHSDTTFPAGLTASNSSSTFSGRGRGQSSLLAVDHRFLQPERELRRLFGSRVVQEQQQQRQRGHRDHHTSHRGRSGHVMAARPNWPPAVRLGLQMRQIESPFEEQQQAGRWFVVEHSRDYQRTQALFHQAVDSLDPDNLRVVLHEQPYHVDTLLQFSDVFRAQEDSETAADLLMRALYAFECAFHSSFSFARGDCRLDYRQQENRGFFVALFRYILYLSRQGCYRTALEFCKALLSLQPDEDPLCVLLMIDWFALMAGEHAFFLVSHECSYRLCLEMSAYHHI